MWALTKTISTAPANSTAIVTPATTAIITQKRSSAWSLLRHHKQRQMACELTVEDLGGDAVTDRLHRNDVECIAEHSEERRPGIASNLSRHGYQLSLIN